MLNLTQMEAAYLAWDANALEVRRTVSMAQEMADALADSSFNAKVKEALGEKPTTGIHQLALMLQTAGRSLASWHPISQTFPS